MSTVKYLMIAGLLFVSACNTVEGFGEDVETGGDMIEKSAERTKEDMPRN
jgi:predicted small secreted protein